MISLVAPPTSNGSSGGSVPDWLYSVNDLAQSWWSIFNPPVTSGPVVDWAEQQRQRAAVEAAQRSQQTTQTVLLVGVALVVLYLVLSSR